MREPHSTGSFARNDIRVTELAGFAQQIDGLIANRMAELDSRCEEEMKVFHYLTRKAGVAPMAVALEFGSVKRAFRLEEAAAERCAEQACIRYSQGIEFSAGQDSPARQISPSASLGEAIAYAILTARDLARTPVNTVVKTKNRQKVESNPEYGRLRSKLEEVLAAIDAFKFTVTDAYGKVIQPDRRLISEMSRDINIEFLLSIGSDLEFQKEIVACIDNDFIVHKLRESHAYALGRHHQWNYIHADLKIQRLKAWLRNPPVAIEFGHALTERAQLRASLEQLYATYQNESETEGQQCAEASEVMFLIDEILAGKMQSSGEPKAELIKRETNRIQELFGKDGYDPARLANLQVIRQQTGGKLAVIDLGQLDAKNEDNRYIAVVFEEIAEDGTVVESVIADSLQIDHNAIYYFNGQFGYETYGDAKAWRSIMIGQERCNARLQGAINFKHRKTQEQTLQKMLDVVTSRSEVITKASFEAANREQRNRRHRERRLVGRIATS